MRAGNRYDTDTQTDKKETATVRVYDFFLFFLKADVCVICISHTLGGNLGAMKTLFSLPAAWPHSMGKRLEMLSPLAAQHLVEGGNSYHRSYF